jgi:hypothetical protein
MNSWIYRVGVGGGVLTTALLYYPLYNYLPGNYVVGWSNAEASLAWVLSGLAVITFLVTGGIAARLSGLKSRGEAALDGALAGFIAVMIAWVVVISPASGIWGGRSILLRGLAPASEDSDYIALVMDGTLNVMWWSCTALWASILAGLSLGGLGGLAAGPGGKAEEGSDELSVPMSITAMLTAWLAFAIPLSVFNILTDTMQKAADESGLTPPIPILSLLISPVLTAFIYLLACQAIAWHAVHKVSAGASRCSTSWLVSGCVNAASPLALIAILFFLRRATFVQFPWFIMAGFLVSAGIGLPAARTSWNLRRLPAPEMHRPLAARRFIAGWLIITALLVVGGYLAGAGAALNVMLLVITALPAWAAYGSQTVNPADVPTLVDLVRTNYAGSWQFLTQSLLPAALGFAGVVSAAAWGVDRLLLPRIKWPKPGDKPAAEF